MTFLAVLVLFSVIIIIHEYGHFLAARKSGVKVISFNIGLGPVIYSYRRAGTLYALRLFPLGGAVELAGLDEEAKAKAKPSEKYPNKPLRSRFMIILAGSLMNILLAFLIYAFNYSIVGVPEGISPMIAVVVKGTPAFSAGLRAGDKLLEVSGYKLGDPAKAIKIIHNTQKDGRVGLALERSGKIIYREIPVTYNSQLKVSVIGIILAPEKNVKVPIWKGIWYGLQETTYLTAMFFIGLGSFFSNINQVVGPVGIVSMSAEAAHKGWEVYLRFMAMLSLNIGLLNLLPFPALDGGRLVFLLFEAITRHKPSKELEKNVHALGFMFLMFLIVLVTYQDILRLFGLR